MNKVELAKRKLNIQQQTDIECLRTHALWLLEQCWALARGRPDFDNYRVDTWNWNKEKWFTHLAEGTKDFCIGWYEGHNEPMESQRLQVACGDFVVWPEEWYGLSAVLSPQNKDKEAER